MDHFHGDFDLSLPKEFSDTDSDDGFLLDIDIGQIIASSVGQHRELENMNKLPPEESDLPPPETPAAPKQLKRFVDISNDELKNYEALNQSKSTKKNTKWGVRILQDWHEEMHGCQLDLENVPLDELAGKLAKFYCGAKPKDTNKRAESMPKSQAEHYHKNTMKNIRAAINRHLQDIGRNIDIVHDAVFRQANKSLNGLLKERLKSGLSRPTQHKDIIENTDLNKISTYFENAETSPIKLRQCVWYQLAIHFVTRGLEFHHQLMTDSFDFKKDENGMEYACLNHETLQKNFQGGLQNNEALSDKRMYATGSNQCPITLLKLFIDKTDKKAKFLFNTCFKEALNTPAYLQAWYTTKQLTKTTFNNFMPDISKHAGCSKRYTAHCLRATSIQALSDAGFEARQIMFMSGHRNEGSIRSYSRHCSTNQKQQLSETLSYIASGTQVITPVTHALPSLPSSSCRQLVSLPASSITNDSDFQLSSSPPRRACVAFPSHDETINVTTSVTKQSTHSTSMPGFMASSTFNNCTFNFGN